ncbi:MAG: hypothetical protein ACLFMO_03660 [Eubacteriales bacterium]
MQSIAKAILKAILVTVCILLFVNLIFFFPWYMTLVVETFNLSQTAANDNYVKQEYYNNTLNRLKEHAIFNEKSEDIEIIVLNSDGNTAIGNNDETMYENFSQYDKPYRQRGEPVTIEINAVYPLSITLWGKKYEREIPVSFQLEAIGLKHYKDLEFNEWNDG